MLAEFFSDWRLAAVCLWMVAGAVIDVWKFKVPNWLTFSMILCAWGYWATVGPRELGISVLATFVAGSVLLVLYCVGMMGAGDVKMYAGFGAWMVPLPWFGFYHLAVAFAVSVVVGGLMGAAMILWKGRFLLSLENLKDLGRDWQASPSLEEFARKTRARKPTLDKLPYGLPLTVGSLAYLWYIYPTAVAATTGVALAAILL